MCCVGVDHIGVLTEYVVVAGDVAYAFCHFGCASCVDVASTTAIR